MINTRKVHKGAELYNICFLLGYATVLHKFEESDQEVIILSYEPTFTKLDVRRNDGNAPTAKDTYYTKVIYLLTPQQRGTGLIPIIGHVAEEDLS